MSENMCLVKIYNKNINFKIEIKQIKFKDNNIVFKDLNLYDLKNILNSKHNINIENNIFISKGIILNNNYILKKNDIIIMINKNISIFKISKVINIIDENKIDINKYKKELKYLKIYPEIIPFIYLIKESPIYLESFLKELKNTESILYNIIKKNETLFINLFNIPDKIIKKLIEYNLENTIEDEIDTSQSSSDDYNNMLSSSEIRELEDDNEIEKQEINENNSIILDLNDNNHEINEIYQIFPDVSKIDIINYYNIFNSNKENVINFIYENYEI
jgi:hypothetical protein